MRIRHRIALSLMVALWCAPFLAAIGVAACTPENEADDEPTREARGLGTSPSASSIQDAGPDAQVK
jgi:hypothetical protein